MSENLAQPAPRPDYIDNGQWHLAVDISKHGFGAWLLPEESLARSTRVIVNRTWDSADEGLLAKIEDTVYDNPTLLDDFSADIIVECDRQLWLPAELYPTDEDCAEAYSSIYGCNPADVMVNELGAEKCAFMLTPGLKSFMQRSFPGVRIWSQQSLLKEAAIQKQEAFKCVVDIRRSTFDLILLYRNDLLSASTHEWTTDADIAYLIFNIMQTYEAPADDTEIVFSGIKEIRQQLGKALQPYFKSISQKSHSLDGSEIPSAVYLAINRKKNYAHHTR